jgi:hypothetical protein
VLISSQNRIQKGPLELLVNKTQLGFWEKRICDKLAVCVAPVPGSGSEVQLRGRHATQLSPILLFLFRLLPLTDTDFYSMHDMVGCEVGRIISRVVEHSSIFFFSMAVFKPISAIPPSACNMPSVYSNSPDIQKKGTSKQAR